MGTPCDFEKMKRLDSAASSATNPPPTVAAPHSPSIPPVLPPRGLEMSRTSHSTRDHSTNQSQGQSVKDHDEREALQRRVKELEDTLHHLTVNGQTTTTSNGTKNI